MGLFYLAPAYTNQPQIPSSEKWKRRRAIPYTTAYEPDQRREDNSPMGRQDMKMHNSPDVWTLIVTWVAEHRGELLSALVAAIMALLRGWYAGGGRTQRMLDAAMCSIIAWFLKDIFVLLSIDQGWAMVSSVFIGYLGTDYIGSVLKRIVGNKTGAGNANQ